MKLLTVERPYEPVTVIPWDEGAVRRYKLDTDEIDLMERGEILWRGETAFSLEEVEE